MKRFVSLWLPYWPVERMRRARPKLISEDHPLVLVTSGGRGIEITAVNRRAEADGLWVGQALADARAMVPSLQSLPAQQPEDAAALERLAFWCGRYGPQRNVHGETGVWIDVTGVAHLFGGEARLMDDIVRRFEGFGVTVRAGLADTFAAAFALARFGGHRFRIADTGALRKTLASFPVDALRLDAQALLLLKRLGLRRVGQLYDLPRASLERRFNDTNFGRGQSGRGKGGRVKGGKNGGGGRRPAKGEDLAAAVLLRLDQALGLAAEPLAPLAEPPVLSVRQSWTDPLISAEGLAAEVRVLAMRLAQQLEAQGLGCRSVRLSLYRADGTAADVSVGTSMACRDGEHLMRLISEKFASVDAGFGIDVAELGAGLVEPMAGTQRRLGVGQGGGEADGKALAELVDRLTNRLGAGQVQLLKARESHIPERAECRVAACDQLSGRAGSGGLKFEDEPVAAVRAAPPPRPLLLLPAPELIDVTEEQSCGMPVAFTWRRVAHRVLHLEGPERIAPEWWRMIGRRQGQQDSGRDYYRVEATGGGRYWIFRALPVEAEDGAAGMEPGVPQRWFLHGLYGGR
jgi:protein ImuB